MACPRTCVVVRSFTTGAIIKDGHARIVIHAPGDHSPLGPDTFSQTASRPTQFFLHSGGGPYIITPTYLSGTPLLGTESRKLWTRRVAADARVPSSLGVLFTSLLFFQSQ